MSINLAGAQLKAYEGVIERGQQTFVEVGQALAKIREGRLYKQAGYATFDDYCQQRWAMRKSYASQLISASRVGEEFRTLNNEGQAHALRNVPEPQRAEVMVQVEQSGKPITAAAITQAAQAEEVRQDAPVQTCQHCTIHCP